MGSGNNTEVKITSILDKPLQKFVYTRAVPIHAVNIAYVETAPISALCVININEELNIFPENKNLYDENLISYLTNEDDNSTYKSFGIKSKYFLVTDRYNFYKEPLFYCHKLMSNPWINYTNKTTVLIIDSDGNEIDTNKILYDPQEKCIYHNLKNNSNEDTYKVYYVKYINADENNNIINSAYEEILNSIPAYTELDNTNFGKNSLTILNKLSMYANNYIIRFNYDDSTKQAFPYIITLPKISKWAIKYTKGNGIRLYYPNRTEIDKPWYLKVSFDTIERIYNEALYGSANSSVYTILEYSQQYFNPFPPYSIVKFDKAKYVTDNIIKVSNTDLLVETNYPLEVIVFDTKGNYKYAFTTNLEQSSKLNTLNNETITWQPLSLSDIDKSNGFINLRAPVSFTDEIKATYFYKTKYYTFSSKNFNPKFDNANFLQETLIYCKPYTINTTTGENYNTNIAKSLYYITFFTNGEVYDLNTWKYACNDPELHVDNDLNNELVISTKTEFVNNYTYNKDNTNDKNWLVLGAITVIHNNSVNEAIVLDTRTYGGGLKDIESINTTINQLYPETQWYYDLGYWDGKAFPGAGACVVKLPDDLLSLYTEEEIRAKVKKHIAVGVYPIIEYYYACGGGYGDSPYGACPYGE